MHDASFRLALFLTLLVVLGVAEWRWPRQPSSPRRRQRWPVNIGLGLINTLCLRLLLPWLAIDAALWAQAHDFGLLHQWRLPTWSGAVIGFVALDLLIYTQHRLMHRVEWLWRLHRMHHTDLHLDVSSGVRFHPLEILLSMGIKIAAVLLLGVAPAVVLAFELVLSSFSLLTHTNVNLPPRLDRWLRWVFVTPDMHRIHHSVLRAEHDRNFCFHVSWWDRLFGSYLDAPGQPQPTLQLGLDVFRDAESQRLTSLLIQPLKKSH